LTGQDRSSFKPTPGYLTRQSPLSLFFILQA
jgi:hypothetical protein